MGNYVRMFTRIQLNRGALSPLIGLHEEGEDDDVVVDDDGTAHTFNHKCFWVFPLLTKGVWCLKACSGFLDSCLRLGFICCACVLCRVLEKFEGGSLFLRIMFLLHFENCLSIFFLYDEPDTCSAQYSLKAEDTLLLQSGRHLISAKE